LYSFCQQQDCTDGQNLEAAPIDVKGTLYGTTAFGGIGGGLGGGGGGVMFSLDPATGTEKSLYVFCSLANCQDGANPRGSLIDVNGTLYGVTSGGGDTGCGGYGCGTVFSIDPNTGAEKVIYSFCSQQNCADGATPFAGLIVVKGVLYGTTQNGGRTGCGNYGCGTVFSIDPNTGAEKVLYSFCSLTNCADGATPSANLITVKGMLYGTTSGGGSYAEGTVFALTKR
ncbi:MAG TPA: choice-of-anchor tandem repeat GloVer-containing protein, partial [Rhizomicrobium sp.]|nr:choice-of-anchor tandem repeat GloVer-containing protein [Rhizomicrobium sp.]